MMKFGTGLLMTATGNNLMKWLKLSWLVIALAGVQLISTTAAKAQSKEEGAEDEGEVVTTLTPANKNAEFDKNAKYTFEVKNGTNTLQEGKVSYTVSTALGKVFHRDSLKVKIAKKSTEKYNFEVPGDGPGFYKVTFMINVTEYDDSTRRVFGVHPEKIEAKRDKPKDFDAFWENVKFELAKVKPKFKVTPMPKLDKDNRHVYLFEMQSLDDMTIRGWLTVPITKNPNKKFSVLLGLPGYQVALQPMMGTDDDLAIITLNVRGQGNSRGKVDTRRDEFIFYRVDNKNKYVMRGVIADCLRGIDFIFSRDDLKHDQILVSGGSMGGFLSLATAGLDKRVRLCSAQNPIFCDIRGLVGTVTWPINDIKKYVRTQPGLSLDKVLDNLDYYDAKNFAANITCSTIMGIGLLDPFAPPANEYAAFNNLKGEKRMMVFKDLGHEISTAYKNLEGRWMRDTFALF
ncbi:acetylxylan esterase [Mucilaginibacter sp. UYCu711]|uniref:acetylxylan esterase n=1 Tax=Mucilaginibacter sp. UYCu711 TaxID=3156339 RepID=UPI003D22B110